MKYKLITYRTLTGTKDVLLTSKKRSGQWIVYQNNEPTYFVDCFDYKNESNLILNYLIISKRKSIDTIINKIKKEKKVKLSIVKPPIFEIQIKTEIKELNLKPLPEAWIQ
jgi:hypothetical protein